MSLHTIVSRGLAGRRGLHPARVAVASRTIVRAREAMLGGQSMRVLETGLAMTAIATAVLLGMGR